MFKIFIFLLNLSAGSEAYPGRLPSYSPYVSDEQDSSSVDSYTLAMEEGGRYGVPHRL